MSSTLVVLGAILIVGHPHKTMARKETGKRDTASEVKHRHGNSAASLSMDPLSSQLYTVDFNA